MQYVSILTHGLCLHILFLGWFGVSGQIVPPLGLGGAKNHGSVFWFVS